MSHGTIATPKTTAELRRLVRTHYPHIRISVRTVDFTDLLRAKAKCLSIDGDREPGEVRQINEWATALGIVPDGNVRFYPSHPSPAEDSE